jgi:6-phosphogluconolactonase
VKTLVWMTVAASLLGVVGCNIGGKYTVGGTLTGLTGQGLVLQDNSGNDLGLASNGAFVFTDGIKNGDTYSVTVKTQPSTPSQTCTVQNASGTIDKANVANILVTCTQVGRFAYVANQLSNNLSAYAINSTTGALSPVSGSPFAATGTTPAALAVDPNGLFLYVANNGSNNVSVYSINDSSGALTATGIPVTAGSGPVALTVDPTDSYLYVANLASNSVSAYTIDGGNGTLTELSNSPFAVGAGPSSLKVSPNGNFLYVTELQRRQCCGIGDRLHHGFLECNSRVSRLPPVPAPCRLPSTPTGRYAYVANETAATISLYSINGSTGALTAISGSPLASVTSPESLVADPAGRYRIRRQCNRQESGGHLFHYAEQRRVDSDGHARRRGHLSHQPHCSIHPVNSPTQRTMTPTMSPPTPSMPPQAC